MNFDVTVWLRSDGEPAFQVGARSGVGAAALQAALAATQARSTLLLLPSERVLPLEIEVPARTRRLLARALPFAVEEKLAVDLDAVHIAHGELTPGAATVARVIDRSYLDDVLAQARAWGLDVRSAQVDAERVPGAADINVLIDGTRAMLRTTGNKALAVDRGQLPLALGLVARAQGAGEPVVAVTALATTLPDDAEMRVLIEAMPAIGASTPFASCADLLTALTDGDSNAGIEILQGRYAPVRDRQIPLGPWRIAAIAAGAWLVTQIGLDIAQGWWLDRQADKAQLAAATMYQQIFPNEAAPADLRRALRGHLGQGGPAMGARPMLGILAGAVGGDPGITLESLSYQRERDELGVQLLARNLADLDRLKQTVERAAVHAQINSAEQQENQVRARLRIRHGGQPG